MSKIKVAYLDYSPIFAGAERVLSTIIQNIDKMRFEPILVFPYPQEHQKGYDSLSCKKFYLAGGLKWWMGSDRWKHPLRGSDFIKRTIMGCRLAYILKRENVDILHVNLLRVDALMWILPSKMMGIKVIGHFRSQDTSWIAPPSTQKVCDMILCVSKYSRERMLTKGTHTDSLVVYDSVNTNLFHPLDDKKKFKKKLGFNENSFLMTSVGQLSRHKGHDNAIRAFANIANEFPSVLLFIAGGGSPDNLAYLKSIYNDYPYLKDRVIFSEKQLTNIKDVYAASDLVLSLTKVGEAFGLVPYEAALVGTSFIAPNMGAVKEFVVDGENGLLVDTNDVNAIANKIKWAIEHPNECKTMSDKIKRTIAENLTPEEMTRNLEDVYEKLYKGK